MFPCFFFDYCWNYAELEWDAYIENIINFDVDYVYIINNVHTSELGIRIEKVTGMWEKI